VSGCRTHHELVGGYLLGALDPAEMEEMHRHVPSCQHCTRELRELGGVPVLLETIEPADVPPPTLPPETEEAVLDRFARERGAAPPRRRRPQWLTGRVLAFAAAAAAALALVLVLVLPFGDDGESAYASAELTGLAPGSGAGASATVSYVRSGTRVELSASGLRGDGAVYELWCVRKDGRWVSGGTFHATDDGTASAELTAAVWPGDYHVMVVTSRPESAPERMRGTPVLRGRLRY
jgi:hypothetical protein